jgi:signal peptidase I
VLDLVKVQGNSMLPTLAHGDIVICCDWGAIKVNDIVIADVLNVGMVVKRIESIIGDNIVLKGDNKRLGSSVCGIDIPKSSILGRVLLRVSSNLRFNLIKEA